LQHFLKEAAKFGFEKIQQEKVIAMLPKCTLPVTKTCLLCYKKNMKELHVLLKQNKQNTSDSSVNCPYLE